MNPWIQRVWRWTHGDTHWSSQMILTSKTKHDHLLVVSPWVHLQIFWASAIFIGIYEAPFVDFIWLVGIFKIHFSGSRLQSLAYQIDIYQMQWIHADHVLIEGFRLDMFLCYLILFVNPWWSTILSIISNNCQIPACHCFIRKQNICM